MPSRFLAHVPAARRAYGLLATLTLALTLLVLRPATVLAAGAKGDDVPLDLGSEDATSDQVGTSGGSIARVIVGLLVVVAVIYGVTWILRQVKGGRGADGAAGTGLEPIATMPLHGGSALTLVRVGNELLLVGSGTHGATTLRRYAEDEARALGLWPDTASAITAPGVGPVPGPLVVSALADDQPIARPKTLPGVAGTLLDRLRAMTVRG